MKIDLPFALQRYVDAQVETGRFVDAADVVRATLRKDVPNDGLTGSIGLSFEDGDLMTLVAVV